MTENTLQKDDLETTTGDEDAAFEARLSEIQAAEARAESAPSTSDLIKERGLYEGMVEEGAGGDEPPPPAAFIGEYTAEEVLSLLEKVKGLDELSSNVQTEVERKLAGHLGTMGRKVKAIEESLAKEWQFNPESLAKVKEIDEALYDALVEGLGSGLKVQSLPVTEAFGTTFEERQNALRLEMRDEMEERLLRRTVGDPYGIVQKAGDGWVKFLQTRPAEERDAVLRWGAQDENGNPLIGSKDAEPVIRVFNAWQEKQAADEKARKEKEDKLRRVAQPASRRQGTPQSSPAIEDEETAFLARLKEIREQGLQL